MSLVSSLRTNYVPILQKIQKMKKQYFIDMKVDAIVLVTIDGDGLTDSIKAAKDAGIPVICYDRIVRMPMRIFIYLLIMKQSGITWLKLYAKR